MTESEAHSKFLQFDHKFSDDSKGTFASFNDIVPLGRSELTNAHSGLATLLETICFSERSFKSLTETFNNADSDASYCDAAYAWCKRTMIGTTGFLKSPMGKVKRVQ